MRPVYKFLFIIITAISIGFTGHTAIIMAGVKGGGDEPTDPSKKEMPLKNQFPYSTLLAQANPDAANSTAAGSDNGDAADKAKKMAEIAEAMNNPLSYLWLLFIQNDAAWWTGDKLDMLNTGTKFQNTTLIQPVMSVQLTEKWKSIFRPVIPINSFNTVGNMNISTDTPGQVTGVDFERKTGLGDIVLWNAYSNSYTPPFVWGFGPTLMFPTATDDQLGTGKWSAGPMGLGVYVGEKWIIGGVAQHWWSFAGDDDITVDTSSGPMTVERPDVNLTDFQYILRYRLTPSTNIGCAPNIRYNWETSQLNFPVGIGGDTLIKLGPLPVKIGAELQYYVSRSDDFGPEWLLRFYFVPVVSAPEWSRTPLF